MQPRSLDEARSLYPDLGFTLYAQTPRGGVTLEIIDGDKTFAWTETSEARVWGVAFPVDEPETVPDVSDLSAETPPLPSVFD